MIDNNNQKALFANVSGKRTEADFTGGRISSDGGALLPREVDRRIGLTDRLSKVIPDRRDQSRIHHSLAELLKQRIYGLALGYEDLNDHDSLRDDPGLQTSVGRDPGEEKALGSSPTLCRLENGIDKKPYGKSRKSWSICLLSPTILHPKSWFLILMLQTIPYMANKKATFSMVTMIITATCLCMFFAMTNLLLPTFGVAILMRLAP